MELFLSDEAALARGLGVGAEFAFSRRERPARPGRRREGSCIGAQPFVPVEIDDFNVDELLSENDDGMLHLVGVARKWWGRRCGGGGGGRRESGDGVRAREGEAELRVGRRGGEDTGERRA